MRKKSTLVALSMAFVVAVPLALAQGNEMNSGDTSAQTQAQTQAQPRMKKRRKGKRNRAKQKYNIRILNRVSNLTDDQSAKLESIQSSLKSDVEPIVAKMRTLKEELQGKRKDAWDKAFAILTDEQKTELESIKESRKKRLRDGGKKRKRMKGAKKLRRKKLKQQNNLESVSNSISNSSEDAGTPNQ